jgi:hypothetical protein
VVVLAQAVAMLVAPPGSFIEDMASLKRVTGRDQPDDRPAAQGLRSRSRQCRVQGLGPADLRRALETKELRVVLLVILLAEKYLVLVRGLFPQNAKTAPVLIPIDFAGAIARRAQTEGAGTGFALCAGAKDKRR